MKKEVEEWKSRYGKCRLIIKQGDITEEDTDAIQSTLPTLASREGGGVAWSNSPGRRPENC